MSLKWERFDKKIFLKKTTIFDRVSFRDKNMYAYEVCSVRCGTWYLVRPYLVVCSAAADIDLKIIIRQVKSCDFTFVMGGENFSIRTCTSDSLQKSTTGI